MCARACTFMYQGEQYRDTDWYEARTIGGPVTMTGRASFPYQMILIYGTSCNNLQYDLTQADACEDAFLSHDMPAGVDVWLWHAPSVFEGVPESRYVFTVCGIADNPVPVERTSWGQLKSRFLPRQR